MPRLDLQVGIDAKYPRVRHLDTKHTSQTSDWNLQPIRNAIRFTAERIVGGQSALGRIGVWADVGWDIQRSIRAAARICTSPPAPIESAANPFLQVPLKMLPTMFLAKATTNAVQNSAERKIAPHGILRIQANLGKTMDPAKPMICPSATGHALHETAYGDVQSVLLILNGAATNDAKVISPRSADSRPFARRLAAGVSSLDVFFVSSQVGLRVTSMYRANFRPCGRS